jgi:arylformamidase
VTLYDATLLLTPEIATWPGEPAPQRKLIKTVAQDGANVSLLTMGVHSGTHIDAPCHFIEGAPGIESIPVDALVGPGLVVDTGDADSVSVALLERLALPAGLERVLFKTKTGRLLSERQFQQDYVYIEPEAAHWLVARGLRLVGIDYLSVERFGAVGGPVHHALLEARVVIVEGCDLRNVPPGPYDIIALPARLDGSDGAPTRLVLRTP